MSRKEVIPSTQFDMTQLTQERAVDWVQQCEQAPVEELWKKLSAYISQLKTASCFSTVDTLESFTHVVYKGFQHKSEEANALRFFYWGYFARKQEEVVSTASRDCQAKAINIIASSKHFPEIMQYLYINGCSQQKDIVTSLGVDKSNLSRVLKILVNCGLITKQSGPKHVFYELSPDGYLYYKKHDVAYRYSSNLLKRSVRLQSEAIQMRDELYHSESNRIFYNFEQATLPTSKKIIGEDSYAEVQCIEPDNSTLRIFSRRENCGPERQFDANSLSKESKYTSRNYILTNGW